VRVSDDDCWLCFAYLDMVGNFTTSGYDGMVHRGMPPISNPLMSDDQHITRGCPTASAFLQQAACFVQLDQVCTKST